MALSNATTRVLTALVGIPLVLGSVYLGGWVMGVLVALLALGAQDEFYRLSSAGDVTPHYGVGLALGALVALRALWPPLLDVALAGAVIYTCALPFIADRAHLPAAFGTTLGGVLYPTALLTALTSLRVEAGLALPRAEAFWLTMSVFVAVWASDTLAYYAGRTFGKHPLAPRVSPKKTVEGALGGLIGAFAGVALLKVLALPSLAWPHAAVLALLGGAVSPLGDLAESRLKRSVGVKDSGTILPGHGGLLDRFDALIVAAPLAYLYLHWAMGW